MTPVNRWDNCPAVSTQPVRFGQMYPGRRFALPWAISFCPFGAAGSMVDSLITKAEQPNSPRARWYVPRSMGCPFFDLTSWLGCLCNA